MGAGGTHSEENASMTRFRAPTAVPSMSGQVGGIAESRWPRWGVSSNRRACSLNTPVMQYESRASEGAEPLGDASTLDTALVVSAPNARVPGAKKLAR